MTLASIGLLVGAAISLVAALAVRYAGEARVFNMIDYRRADATALNAAVGRRLMALPIAFVALAVVAWRWPWLDLPAIAGSVLVTIAVAAWAASARPMRAEHPEAD